MNERERIRKEIFGKSGNKAQEQPVITPEDNPDVNPGLFKMFTPRRLARIMRKEVRRYEQAQKKKWNNWWESVSK